MARSLSRASGITVRDPLRAAYLEEIAPSLHPEITGDDAITLEGSSEDRIRKLLTASGLSGGREYLAFHFRAFMEYGTAEMVRRFASYVDEASAVSGLPVVGVPMHFLSIDERMGLQQVAHALRRRDRFYFIDETISPSDAKGLFAGAALAFGIGGHAGILSLTSGTPFLGLFCGVHYQRKMTGLAECTDFLNC